MHVRGDVGVDLGLHPGLFGAQDVQALLELGDAVKLQVLAAGFDQALAAKPSNRTRLRIERVSEQPRWLALLSPVILIAAALRKDPVAVVNKMEVILRAAAKLTGFLPEVRDAFGLNPQAPQEADAE